MRKIFGVTDLYHSQFHNATGTYRYGRGMEDLIDKSTFLHEVRMEYFCSSLVCDETVELHVGVSSKLSLGKVYTA
jgi:hypothetical protein